MKVLCEVTNYRNTTLTLKLKCFSEISADVIGPEEKTAKHAVQNVLACVKGYHILLDCKLVEL